MKLRSNKEETLRIIGYNEREDFHICLDGKGINRQIVLTLLNDDIPDAEHLIGRTVKISGTRVYIEIAENVTLID